MEFWLNRILVASGAPVPALLMRTARPAPFCSKLFVAVKPLSPSKSRMSAVRLDVEFVNVLKLIVDEVRLKARRPRPLVSNRLFETVMRVAGLVGSVEEKSS